MKHIMCYLDFDADGKVTPNDIGKIVSVIMFIIGVLVVMSVVVGWFTFIMLGSYTHENVTIDAFITGFSIIVIFSTVIIISVYVWEKIQNITLYRCKRQ